MTPPQPTPKPVVVTESDKQLANKVLQACTGLSWRTDDGSLAEIIATYYAPERQRLADAEDERDEVVDLLQKLMARQAIVSSQAQVVERFLKERNLYPRRG